jgi:predicted trehalose synthase
VANVASAGLDASVVGSLRAALADVSGLVDRLVGQAFDMSTPCDGWTVRDVMNHLAAVTEKFSRFAAAASSGPIRQRHGDLLGTEPRRMFRSIL